MTYKIITGTLKARTAVHIGSGAGGDLTDALIRRDAAGAPVIPGTATAGALRALATRLAPRLGGEMCAALRGSDDPCDCSVCHLFGDINPSNAEDATSEASRLLVFNARLNELPQTLVRDGVGINRVTGAAARAGRVKFDLEVLPAGATFELRMELRDTGPEDEQLLAAVLTEWKAGRAWLGGNVARGLGAFALQGIQYKTHALDDADTLLTFLKEDEVWQIADVQLNWLKKCLASVQITPPSDGNPYIARLWLTVEGTLQAQGPLLTNDATTSGVSGFDHAPLLAQLGEWQYPMLAGAGLRGVLRAHAERIARTLATLNANGREDFLQCCPACSPVESWEEASLASCDTLLKDANVPSDADVDDRHLCLACRLFGSTRRGSRLIVEDASYQPTDQQDKPVLKMLDFLAIDRFTGGGAKGAKFDALVLWKPAFTLRLHLDNPAPWELGWLALVLRDLAEGQLSVGSGAAKGLGRVKLTDWTARLGYLDEQDALGAVQVGNGQKDGVYTRVDLPGHSEAWLRLADGWVKEFVQQVKAFAREDNLHLKKDSYFNEHHLERLYPKEVAR